MIRTFALALAALLAAAPAHAADGGLAKIKKAGKLIVAMDATYPPMESEDLDGQLVGFDVDFAKELAKRLGVKAEFMVMGWEGIIGGLVSNRYDLVISSMNVTPDRQKQVSFVEYARMSQLFVTKKGAEVKGEKDLAGKVVTVPTDTTSFDYVTKAKAAGVAIKEIKAYRLTSEVFMAVKTGHADVLVVDEPVARFYAKQDKDTFVVSGRAIEPEPVGIAVRKDDKELEEAVKKAVDEMKKDGSLKKMSEQWFGTELGA